MKTKSNDVFKIYEFGDFEKLTVCSTRRRIEKPNSRIEFLEKLKKNGKTFEQLFYS